MLESRIQANIKKKLTGLGWLVFKFESPGQRGVPDLIVISPDGETVYLEVKQPGKQATAYQAVTSSSLKITWIRPQELRE